MNNCKIVLPEYVAKLLEHLDSKGCTGYLVGGCVRDALMGLPPQDYDIAAAASPEKLKRAFDGYRIVDTGARFGTLTVLVQEHSVEITSFRRDGTYTDGRHPDKVEFTNSLTEDLARRDFTVNAMAYRPDTGLIDPFHGKEALRHGILACVGDPYTRFSEDALRILRAMRFCSVLGFTADSRLVAAADKCSPLLHEISVQRIYSELVKFLCGKHVARVMRQFVKPLCTVIPPLEKAVGFDQKNPHHIYTVYDHIAATVEACPPRQLLRLTMLLHDIAKPYVMTEDANGVRHFRGHQERGAQMARQVLTDLGCDKRTIEKVCRLIRWHDLRPAADRISIHRYLLQVGYKDALLLTQIRRADLSAQAPAYHDQFSQIDATEKMIRLLQEEGAPADVSGVAVNGVDLIGIGIRPGPQIGCLLASLLDAVANGEVKNEKHALLQKAVTLQT